MGIESSLKSYLNSPLNKKRIKNSPNPEELIKKLTESFEKNVENGRIILTKGGGYTTSKESQAMADEIFGKARERFGFNPSGKKKGGSVKTSKYSKGGGVRSAKYKV